LEAILAKSLFESNILSSPPKAATWSLIPWLYWAKKDPVVIRVTSAIFNGFCSLSGSAADGVSAALLSVAASADGSDEADADGDTVEEAGGEDDSAAFCSLVQAAKRRNTAVRNQANVFFMEIVHSLYGYEIEMPVHRKTCRCRFSPPESKKIKNSTSPFPMRMAVVELLVDQ
jgi:hypothetical protein